MTRTPRDETRRSFLGVTGALAAALPVQAAVAAPTAGQRAEAVFVGLFQNLEAAVIDPGAALLVTAGFHTPGKGAARYVPDADQTSETSQPWRRRAADGRWFVLSEERPNQYQLGAVGNGKADDTAALQALIDYALYVANLPGVFLAGGQHKTSDTWHIGYGEGRSYTSIVIDGAGSGHAEATGVTIIPTRSDRPCIAVQGARLTRLRGLSLRGPLIEHLRGHGLDTVSPDVSARDLANWIGGYPNGRYNVFCGVAIDPYSGKSPGAAGYPPVSYPAFLGPVAPYGKNYSSDVLIEDCVIAGFVAGVAVQPCPADGNGDFVRLRDVHIEHCPYGVSVGNTQSRLVKLDYVNFNCSFIAITNRAHGHAGVPGASGKLTSEVVSCHFQHIANWFDLTTEFAGPVSFKSCYCESGWRLGDAVSGAALVAPLLFEACEFSFGLADPAYTGWGVPDFELGLSGAGQAVFTGCTFKRFWSVFNVAGGDVTLRACDTWPPANPRAAPYEMAAHNATLGGFVRAVNDGGAPTSATRVDSLKPGQIFSLDTWARAFGARPPVRKAVDGASTRAIGQHLYQEAYLSPNGGLPQLFSRTKGCILPISALVGLSLNGLTLTFRYPKKAASPAAFAPNPGGLLRFSDSLAWFFVSASADHGDGTASVTAVLQNNHVFGPGGAVSYVAPIDIQRGYLTSYAAAQLYNLEDALVADTADGAHGLANVQRGDGAASFGALKAGDSIFVDPSCDNLFHAGSRITSLVPFTLSGPASRSQSRAPLTVFVRPPFAGSA